MIHKLILAALAAYCLASCSLTVDQKKALRADGKAVVTAGGKILWKLAEAEEKILLEDLQK